VAATPIHALVGILELGDRSAALFEINGVSQRVYVGERIGSSGWSLVSVSNEEAVIRRNGEVRSIYIGQRF
jgi:Tfp pilus assembly protein PilP